ncbi:CPBP family intramembrane glutamic endopeptidase [Priestia filamentosa]|uniref:CPBP family intramembrane glutamic endopeptidase n=1 Tax=Priestia filamentosa TaxID=1402861 RepID=UPI003981AA6C
MKKFFYIYGKILIVSLSSLILFAILSSVKADSSLIIRTLFLIQKAMMLLPVLILYRLWDNGKWKLGIIQHNKKLYFTKGALLGFAFMTLSIVITIVLETHRITLHNWNVQMIVSLFYTLFLCLVVSFAEETLFRGYIQGLVKHHYTYTAGIIFSTLFFAAMHGMNNNFSVLAFIELILGGLFLGIVREKTQGLWFGIGFHCFWNFTQSGIFGFLQNKEESISVLSIIFKEKNVITGGEWGPEASIVTSLVLILLIAYLQIKKYGWFKKRSIAQ